MVSPIYESLIIIDVRVVASALKISYLSVASPSSYWEVWRSPVWPWTFSSCSSTPFFCAADGTKTRSSPTLTAAARPGVSSSPHLSAGWYKRWLSRKSGE